MPLHIQPSISREESSHTVHSITSGCVMHALAYIHTCVCAYIVCFVFFTYRNYIIIVSCIIRVSFRKMGKGRGGKTILTKKMGGQRECAR